jgi:multidrug efflux pump subunit AcrA (membrane-fusion protein)
MPDKSAKSACASDPRVASVIEGDSSSQKQKPRATRTFKGIKMMKALAVYLIGISCVLVGSRLTGLDRLLILGTTNSPFSIVNEPLAPALDANPRVQANVSVPAVDDLTSTDILSEDSLVAVVVPKHRQSGEAATNGTLKKVLVGVNDVVSEGAPVALLDAEAIEATIRKQQHQIRLWESKVRNAQDQYSMLKDKLARHRPAAEARAISLDRYNEVKCEVNAAAELINQCEAELEAAQEEAKRLEGESKDYVVKAPFSGKVTRICQHAGQFVQPGEVILEMESTEQQVRALVPAEMSSKLHSLTFHVESESGEPIELAVAQISAQGTASGYQNVFFDLKDAARLISHQPLAVYVNTQAYPAIPGAQLAQTDSIR